MVCPSSAGAEDRPVGDEVGIGSAVRLHIGMLDPEEVPRLLAGLGLNRVDVVASRVETGKDITFGILVGEQVPHRQLGREGAVILARDEFEMAALIGEFLDNRLRDAR